MKNIKQIRENVEIFSEEAEMRKLTTLVRAGLFDAKKLPMLKRALEKNANEMTTAEKKTLIELLDSLMAEVLDSQQVYQKVKTSVMKKDLHEKTEIAKNDYLNKFDPRFDRNASERDLPYIIILKRKAIRVYPDNQKVGLYYSQALDKYVSIPLGNIGSGTISEGVGEKTTVNAPRSSVPSSTKFKKGPWGVRPTEREEKLGKEQDIKDIKKMGAGALYRKNPALYHAAQKEISDMKAPVTVKLAAKAGMALNKAIYKRLHKLPEEKSTKLQQSFKEKLEEKRHNKLNEVAPLAIPAIAGAVSAARVAAPAIAGIVSRAAPVIRSLGTKAVRAGRGALRSLRRGGKGAGAAAGAATGSDSDKKDDGSYEKKFINPIQGGGSVSTSSSFNTSRGRTDSARAERERQQMYRESANFKTIKKLVNDQIQEDVQLKFVDGDVTINSNMAQKIMNLYESVNSQNKKKIKSMMNEDVEGFKKIVTFASRQ